ncbi:hypothetical protein SDC9_164472 [bioreactor metagenome]|uniref:Uncharacterized protein n=1 Tax=bioreactor metagenome TaxID=1076179 RepID=A0A645FTZ9_9ZZZZ
MVGNLGASNALATGFGVMIIDFILIFVHFAFTENTFFNKVPAMFGGVAVTFSQGGKYILPIMITLILGVLLALLSNEGQQFLTKDGHWKWIGSK